jgi:asparagine synthase (glutamine-hydrolysing)
MYVCALRPRGQPLSQADVFGYMARLTRPEDASLETIVDGPFAAIAVSRTGHGQQPLARWRHLTAVGDVRLDNRDEVAAMAGMRPSDAECDLQLVLAALDEQGEGCIRRILGDFALVAWDARAQKLLAVRDAFGVKPLYQRAADNLLLFSSEVAPLRQDESYDLDYLHNQLLGHMTPTQTTVWRGVTSVRPGSLVRQRGTVATRERYWRADEFVPAPDGDEASNCFRFRELLEQAVRTRVENAGDVWAHLSGGLDSSTVVAVARMMEGTGARLAGTVTLVDTLGSGDERVYSDAVVEQYRLRNEQVCDYWAWQDDGAAPPLTDHPTAMYPFFARERRTADIIRAGGSGVVLSGNGADHYLYGNLDYITDMGRALQMRAALRELTNWSVATRQSFWGMSRRYLVEPFLPAVLRRPQHDSPPAWLGPAVRGLAAHPAASRMGQQSRFVSSITNSLEALTTWIDRVPAGDGVDVRYPYLYRPLVEWSLRLPIRQRIRPNQHKWILREATRGVLPESVRTRTTKGGIDARILWSMHREKERIDTLLKDPILAQLGCVDAVRLRAEVEKARRGIPVHNVQLFCALSLETWLAVRHGRWGVQPNRAATAA